MQGTVTIAVVTAHTVRYVLIVGLPCQISSGTISIAPHGHSATQMPQPLQ